ncbi:Dopamine beta-hydroxylase [Portunus trituberculatus]|uniref:Dopamine beta-hydroxylase n=1 Tax=Portunus trituberculatus TaxID=210409 RepID=A0A5B7KH63_PORTR|nr:Dopamine beta-hydroxylase [Portunus trituberculatus]
MVVMGLVLQIVVMMSVVLQMVMVMGRVDSSGLGLHYTKRLRAHDAAIMELGLEYTAKMAIPPHLPSFTLSGYCVPECTALVGSLVHGGSIFFILSWRFNFFLSLFFSWRFNFFILSFLEVQFFFYPYFFLGGSIFFILFLSWRFNFFILSWRFNFLFYFFLGGSIFLLFFLY